MMEFRFCHDCRDMRLHCVLRADGYWYCTEHNPRDPDPVIEAQLGDLSDLAGDLSILLEKNDPPIWTEDWRRKRAQSRAQTVEAAEVVPSSRQYICQDCGQATYGIAYFFFSYGPICKECFGKRTEGMLKNGGR